MLVFMDGKSATLAFSNAPGVGPKGFQKLLKLFRSVEHAWNGSASSPRGSSAEKYKEAGVGRLNFAKFDAFRKEFDIQEYLGKLKKAKVEFIPFGSNEYSERLAGIDAPPIGLYIKGNKK